nr:exonuclease subunit SbcD [Oscillospiraceae bacterium]
MRFLHIADLHLGKVIHGVSLLENNDQPFWIDRFLELTDTLRPDAVVVAGDVYDRGSPSGAAVTQLSRLVEGLAEQGVCVMLIAGNHDSGERLAFAGGLLARQNVYVAGRVEREL